MIAREIDVEDVGTVAARERPDVALVGLSESSEHAPGLIDRIVREAVCPVIVLLHAPPIPRSSGKPPSEACPHISDDRRRGLAELDAIVLRRFAECHDLRGAFGRRALTERATGILMERHSIDEESAFEMLRAHSRSDNRKLIDLAAAFVDGHRLLPSTRTCPRSRDLAPK